MVVSLMDEHIYDDDDVLLELGDLAILSTDLLERLRDLFIDGPLVEAMERVERQLQLELEQAQLEGYNDDEDDESFFPQI